MRSVVKLFMVFSVLFLFSSKVFAAESYFHTSSERIMSGAANVATGWVELPKNIVLTGQKEGPVQGMTIGLAMGIMHTIGRTIVGGLDVATFWVPLGPSVNPPYVWQNYARETSY